MLLLGLRCLFRGLRSITGDGPAVLGLVISRPRAWADANVLSPDTAGVVGLRRWTCSRAAACDASHPFALLGDVMLASNLRLDVARLRLSGRPNQSACHPGRISRAKSVIAGPILARVRRANFVAPSHGRCFDAIGRLS